MVVKNTDLIKEHVDIEEAMDEAGHGRYNLMVLVTSCVITVGTVIEMLGYSLVVPAASCDLNLTLQQGGILRSIGFAGFIFSIPWGYTADTIGRKRTILLSVTAGFIFSALTSFAINYYMMLILKFLASCFSTATLTLITTYLGESTCRKQRNRYLFIQNISNTGTDFVCFVLAYFILPLDFAIPIPYIKVYRSWRFFSLVMSLPLGIGAVMLSFLYETPKFLMNKGNADKTMDVLTHIYKMNHGNSKTCVYPVKSLLKMEVAEKVPFCDSLSMMTLIFKPPLLWKSIQLFLLISICCSTNNVFFMWFPTMANSFFTSDAMNISFCQKIAANITPIHHDDVCTDNNSMNTIYSGMIFSLLFICLNIGAYVLANWRRTMILTFLLITGVSCITVNSITDPIASMVVFCMIQLTVLPLGSIYSYYVDVFPTSCRALAIGLGMMVARFVCLGGVALVGTTVINHCLLTFYCWAAFIFSGIVAAIFLPKEETRKDNIS